MYRVVQDIQRICTELVEIQRICTSSKARYRGYVHPSKVRYRGYVQVLQVRFQKHFPQGDFQMTTSQMCNFPIGNFLKVRLGPLRRHRLQWGGGRALRLGWAMSQAPRLEQTGPERCGSDRLGKNPLRKYLISMYRVEQDIQNV